MTKQIDIETTRKLALVKMEKRTTADDVSPELGKAIAKSMVKSGDGASYVMTAQQLVKCRGGNVTAEVAAEHIAKTCENEKSTSPYIERKNSVFRDAVTGRAVLKNIFLPRRLLQHIFAAGDTMFASAYRNMVFNMYDDLVNTLKNILEYNQKKIETHETRSEAHQKTQAFLREKRLIPRRRKRNGDFVSPIKQASAKTAGMYGDYYAASIHPTKKPRKAAADVGVIMTTSPIIHQSTPVCMEGFNLYMAKVKRKLRLAEQQGVPMTLEEASTKVRNEDHERKTYVQQDLDGNDYSSDDQVRAMTDDGFAAVGVPSSSLPLALPAPQ